MKPNPTPLRRPKLLARSALLALALLALTAVPLRADPHPGQSASVGIISSTFVINGGSFPTTTTGPTGSFTDFTFTLLPAATVNAATLAAHDTILLNVASPIDMNCDVNNLTASQKTDLVNFLNNGGKLIIYDSECPPQDYSWLPHPFTTSNPGALGGVGTVNIVEDNFLGSDTTGDSHFIDEVLLGQQTDAVGDMNVLTTTDPAICLHMAGTNAANQSGPTHVYYQSGSPPLGPGLLIYNGFDVDFMFTGTAPDSSTPAGNIAKIWLQELQQPRNGQGLACAVAVVGIALTPQTATNPVGTQHTVTATVTDSGGNPQSGVLVDFQVTGANVVSGNAGTCNPADCTTNAQGQVTYTYTGTVVGEDKIRGCFVRSGQTICSAEVTKIWEAAGPGPCPPEDDDGNGDDGNGRGDDDDDEDNDGLTNKNETLFLTLLGNSDSDLDGTKDGNDDANGNGEDDEDEDDDECPDDDDSDGDGTDDEDEDDGEDD
jgi:Bacterial Ig-like domain (group 1)